MKKAIIVTIAVLCAMPFFAEAQHKVKFGHLDLEEVYDVMPGKDTIDVIFKEFRAGLEAEGLAMQKEVETAYTEYQQKQHTYTPAQAKIKQEEIQKMYHKLQEFTANANDMLEDKKEELIMPFQKRILEAAEEVGREEGYTYIFNAQALSYGAESENIADKVKAKLGIQ